MSSASSPQQEYIRNIANCTFLLWILVTQVWPNAGCQGKCDRGIENGLLEGKSQFSRLRLFTLVAIESIQRSPDYASHFNYRHIKLCQNMDNFILI